MKKFFIYNSKRFFLAPNSTDTDTISITENFFVKQILVDAPNEVLFELEDNTYNEKWNSKPISSNLFKVSNGLIIPIKYRILRKNTIVNITVSNIQTVSTPFSLALVGYRLSDDELIKQTIKK
jgi:hypothetical protein